MVRNSSLDVTVVMFTLLLLFVEDGSDVDVALALLWAAVEEVTMVVGPRDGELPGACWISLPCSAISAGPSLISFLRN